MGKIILNLDINRKTERTKKWTSDVQSDRRISFLEGMTKQITQKCVSEPHNWSADHIFLIQDATDREPCFAIPDNDYVISVAKMLIWRW